MADRTECAALAQNADDALRNEPARVTVIVKAGGSKVEVH